MSDTAFGKFFLPGPTEVHPDVAAAQLRPMMSHRSGEFRALFARVQDGLRMVFQTARPMVVVAGSSTSLMEMSVRSAPPGRVLALVNGGFSERFAKIARACGRDVDDYTVPWGHAHDIGALHALLTKTRYAAVTVVHSETSTGVLNDIANTTRVAHEHGAVALVDTVSSMGGAHIPTDAWELDFVFAGSQKTIAIPPGLAFGAASENIVAAARVNATRGTYLDLAEYVDSAAKNETPSTPALSLLQALDVQLVRIAAEGLAPRVARHAAMASAVYRWVGQMSSAGYSVGILAPDGYRSPAVSVLTLDAEFPTADVLHAMKSRGFTLGAGYGLLKQNSVRIGHMGDHTVAGVSACLSALEDAMRALRARGRSA